MKKYVQFCWKLCNMNQLFLKARVPAKLNGFINQIVLRLKKKISSYLGESTVQQFLFIECIEYIQYLHLHGWLRTVSQTQYSQTCHLLQSTPKLVTFHKVLQNLSPLTNQVLPKYRALRVPLMYMRQRSICIYTDDLYSETCHIYSINHPQS